MRIFLFRLFGCTAALLICCFIFRLPFELFSMSMSILLLTLFYMILRPVFSLLILPVNMFLFGAPGLFLDALFIRLIAGRLLGLSYLHSFFAAAIIAVCFIPYGQIRRLKL